MKQGPLKDPNMAQFQNREITKRAPIARSIEKWLGIPFNALELAGSFLLVRPMNWALRHLDGLSYRLDGTALKAFLQHTLFPFTLFAGCYLAFEVAESGASLQSISTLLLLPVVIGLFVAPIERLLPFSRKWLEGGNDTSVDVIMFFHQAFWNGLAQYLVQVVLLVGLIAMIEPYGHGLWPSSLPGVVQVFLFILIRDFFRYWLHRAMHEVPFLWRFHAAHHSAERLYWLNGIRGHPMEAIGQVCFYALPFALLQPEAEIALVAVFVQLTIGIFQHANIDLKLGFWEYIFSIGDNHRYHHYPNKDVGDSNYGGEFIVWDILFGTFHKVKGERPDDRIGIGTAPNYPMTMAGLLIAPFLSDQGVFGPNEAGPDPKSSDPSIDRAADARTEMH